MGNNLSLASYCRKFVLQTDLASSKRERVLSFFKEKTKTGKSGGWGRSHDGVRKDTQSSGLVFISCTWKMWLDISYKNMHFIFLYYKCTKCSQENSCNPLLFHSFRPADIWVWVCLQSLYLLFGEHWLFMTIICFQRCGL